MIKIRKVILTKAMLSSMNRDERNLFICAGQALNQIIVLYKLISFSSKIIQESSDIENIANSVQSQIFVRMLIGTISETLELLNRRYVHKLMESKYKSALNEEGQLFYGKVKSRHGKSKLLSNIRNGYAFHYPKVDDSESGFSHLAEGEDISIYMHEELSNSCWILSKNVINAGTASLVGKDSAMDSFEALERFPPDLSRRGIHTGVLI